MTAINKKVALPNSTCGAHMYSQGFGTWQAKPGEVYNAVIAAIKAGYRLIDCARIYCNQKEIGEAIKHVITTGLVKREELFIVSKVWNTDHAPEHVAGSTVQTIKDLQCDYLDLLLIHWPVSVQHPKMNGYTTTNSNDLFPLNSAGGALVNGITLSETWGAMENLVKDKLVRDIGVSNFSASQIDEILSKASIKPVANQIEVSIGLQQDELRSFCSSKGIAVMAYCPMGIGMGNASEGLLYNKELIELAKQVYGPEEKTAARLLLRWCSQVGCVTLSKSVTPERIAANASVEADGLNSDIMIKIKNFGNSYKKRVCNPGIFKEFPGPFFSD